MKRENDSNESDFIARRRKANVRLALLLAFVVAAIYFGFILSYM